MSEVLDDRGIFRFQDGTVTRAVDPLDPWEKLWTDEEVDDVKLVMDRCGRGEFDGIKQLAGLTARMFDLKTVEQDGENGWNRLDLLDLFDRFSKCVDGLKKKHGPLPMPSRPLGWKSSALSTTQPASDSSSTQTESTQDAPIGPTEPLEVPSAPPLVEG